MNVTTDNKQRRKHTIKMALNIPAKWTNMVDLLAGEAEQQEGRIHFPLVTYAEKAYHRHVHGLLNKTTMINRIMTSALNQGAATGSTPTRTPMKSPPHPRCSLHPS